jgi:hypothetical protein
MESRQLDAMFDSIVAQRMALNHYSGIEYVGGDDSNVNPSAASGTSSASSGSAADPARQSSSRGAAPTTASAEINWKGWCVCVCCYCWYVDPGGINQRGFLLHEQMLFGQHRVVVGMNVPSAWDRACLQHRSSRSRCRTVDKSLF